MHLGNPAMLIGLLLVAIPILVALLNRQRHREIRWAAMAFLEAALRKNRRRLTVQNLLLLLLRSAIILLLVLALARPFLAEGIVPSALARSNRQITLVLDRSFSMGYRPGTELSSFDRGKEAISEIVRHYARPGDRLQVFLIDEAAEAQYTDPLTLDAATQEKVIREIAEEEPSHFATDISRSLRTVLESVRPVEVGDEDDRAEVFLITDLQRNTWVGDGGLLDPALPDRLRAFGEAKGVLHLIDVGSEGEDNLAIHAFAPADPIITPSVPVRLDAVVRSYSGADVPGVEAALVVDGEVRKHLTHDVPAGKQRTFSFHHVFNEGGSHSVTARLTADHLAVDNERHLALDVRERVPVLIVDGDPQEDPWESETDFLTVALTPTGGDAPGERPLLDLTVVTEADLGAEALEGYAVVVLANVAALASDQVEALERYVSAGGGLLVALGDQVDAEFYGRSLYRDGAGPLPAAPVEAVGEVGGDQYMKMAVEDTGHPALKFFEPEEHRAPLEKNVYFFRCFRTAATLPGVRRLIDLEGGIGTFPLLLEKGYGRGRVMLWTSTLDDAWNAFPRSWAYVALTQLVTVYLSDTASTRRNLIVGDAYEEIVAAAAYADQVTLITPAHVAIPKPLPQDPEGGADFRLSHEACDLAGIYSILFSPGGAESPREEYFAVNLRTEESDLASIDFDELRDLLPGAPLRHTSFDALASLGGSSPEASRAAGMWKVLLGLLVAFLIVETVFARLIGR